MEEDQALLQLLLSSLQILKLLIFPEFSADGSKVEVSISVAKLSALAQQSPVQTQHCLSAPRGHGGPTCTNRHTLANFQREPGQATAVPFSSTPLALRVFRDAKDAEKQRRAGRRTSRRGWNEVAE